MRTVFGVILCQKLDCVLALAQRVLILGDMLELGTNAQQYHEAVKADIIRARPDRVLSELKVEQ